MVTTAIRRAVVLLALAGRPASAEGLLLTGHVTDDSGHRLPGVSVALGGPGATPVADTVTDASGWYRLHAAPGRYELRFSLVNFGDVTKQIALTDGPSALVNVVLPLAFTADVVVTGRRTLRNIAEAPNPAENLIGLAGAASEGAVTAAQLQHRPLTRPGDVLETVPGLVTTQHSGEGKANQYYLRGFNLDHGTDFAVSVAGVPVNMPTHGHGQGWSDLNFLIPELVSGIQFKKGPYFADEGDFSTAGAANISYVSALERPINQTLELYGNAGSGYHSNDARGVLLSAGAATPLVRTRGAEAGVRAILVPRLQTTVSVWALHAELELLFVGDAGTTEAGRPSRRTGVEWANSYGVRPWLALDGDVAWSSARFIDGSPLGASIPGAVERVASVGLSLGEVRGWAGGGCATSGRSRSWRTPASDQPARCW